MIFFVLYKTKPRDQSYFGKPFLRINLAILWASTQSEAYECVTADGSDVIRVIGVRVTP